MKSLKTIDLSKIPGVEKIRDLEAEVLVGGAFRFAVAPEGSGIARAVESVSGTTTRFPALLTDGAVRLTATNDAGDTFALAIHDADTGQNLRQVRGVNNPVTNNEVINVRGLFTGMTQIPGVGNRRLEYRVRQIAPPGPVAGNGTCEPGEVTEIVAGGTGGTLIYCPHAGNSISDRRLKTDIKVVGLVEDLGIKLYSWKYRNDDLTRYVGVMAQDLLARPDLAHAVVIAYEGEFAGYYAVNYQELGLKMVTEAEWQEQGMAAVFNQSLAAYA